MGSGSEGGRFIDLMVSSQTGSGKTAAFLLPVLHTLIRQQAEAEAAARAEFERAAAEAVARGEAPRSVPSARIPPISAISSPPFRGSGGVPHARTGAAGGARCHRSGQACARPARGQRGGRHAVPIADRQTAERRPGGGDARPPAGSAALDADQTRQGAIPGRRRGGPHARPGLL